MSDDGSRAPRERPHDLPASRSPPVRKASGCLRAFLIISGALLLLPGACFGYLGYVAAEAKGFGAIAVVIFLMAGVLIWVGVTRR